jgi:hypothetical protein
MRPRSPISAVLAAAAFVSLCAMALAPTVFADEAPASGSPRLANEMAVLTGKGLSPARAGEALAVQGEVGRTSLISKLEAALGDAYAEVWFEPAAAEFHIGVISQASRRTAEEVVAQADLSVAVPAAVRYTSVRSTRAQLLHTQQRWTARLRPLFRRQEASTAIDSSINAVSIKLSSSVSSRERHALVHEATNAEVNVAIGIVQPAQLQLSLRSKPSSCPLPFKSQEAYCGATITGGVLITPNKKAKPPWKPPESTYCTAGPLATPKGKENKSETYLLTAGHCTAGTVGKPWYSSTPEPGQVTEELGLATRSVLEANGDYGSVRVDQPGFWTEAGLTPVFAGVVKWTSLTEKAFQVEGEEPSAKGLANCHQGATSGEQCGEVLAVNAETEIDGELKKGLVEDEACGEGGDSGGPWINITKTGELRVDGTEVGGPAEVCVGHTCEGCRSYYEPIKTSLEGLGLELLTKNNEVRPGCRVLAAWNQEPEKGKCANPPGIAITEAQNLREEEDGAAEVPQSTNAVTSGLLVNTKSKIRFGATIGGVKDFNESPTGYAFFGMDLMSNPENSTTVCRAATGMVPFADIQNGKPSAVFDVGTAWSFSVFSDSEACSKLERASKVYIREANLLFEQLGAGKAPVIASGTFVGKYSQPNSEKCPAGGVELENKQPGVTTEPASTAVVVDNGEEGKTAVLCLVSANNYLFPKTAPTWAPFTNSTEKEKLGIWKTKEP